MNRTYSKVAWYDKQDIISIDKEVIIEVVLL